MDNVDPRVAGFEKLLKQFGVTKFAKGKSVNGDPVVLADTTRDSELLGGQLLAEFAAVCEAKDRLAQLLADVSGMLDDAPELNTRSLRH